MDIFTDYLEVINMAKDVKKKNKKKKSKWVRPRHKFFRAILDITLGTYSRIARKNLCLGLTHLDFFFLFFFFTSFAIFITSK